MDSISLRRRATIFSHERLVLIILAIVAIISPLYVDRRAAVEEDDEDETVISSAVVVLPVLLLLFILAIAVSCYLDQRFARFDPYWIHRVFGSSAGILFILTILILVLNSKS